MIWEFYLKYIVKNIKELESVQFKTPQHDIIKRVLNIIDDEKVDKLNDKIKDILKSSPNDAIQRIRVISEYLKNLNRI